MRPGMLVFHPAGESHSETFGESHVASFNVEIGPEWTRRMDEFGILLNQPVEFEGGEVVTLALRMLEELSANDSESGLSIEALTWEILAAFGGARTGVENSQPQWLKDARDTFDSRLDEPLSLRARCPRGRRSSRILRGRFPPIPRLFPRPVSSSEAI